MKKKYYCINKIAQPLNDSEGVPEEKRGRKTFEKITGDTISSVP